MRLITWSVHISKTNSGWLVNREHTGATLCIHLNDVHDHFELTDGHLPYVTTDNTSSNESMTRVLQSTLEASGIECPALRKHIPCVAHIMQLTLGAFKSSLGVEGRTKSWEAHECDQQFGENESIDIGKSQTLRKEGNARINQVSAMRPGLTKIIEKVRISWYFECPETELHMAENACCINCADTWSPKRGRWLSKAKVCIAVLPMMDVKTHRNSTVELRKPAYWLSEFTREWLNNPKYSEYRPVFITQDEWTIVKYVMEVLRQSQYWTLWMLKRYTVTLHHIITVFDDMFDHMDGVTGAVAKKKTRWKEDLFLAVKLARQKMSKCYAEVTPRIGMLHIPTPILNPFWKFQSFRNGDKGMDMNPEDETTYTIQYLNAFLKYVENEYCAKHRLVPVNKLETILRSNLIPSATA